MYICTNRRIVWGRRRTKWSGLDMGTVGYDYIEGKVAGKVLIPLGIRVCGYKN